MSLKQFTKEQLGEMSLIEIAFELLVEKNEALTFKELTAEIGALAGHSKQEVKRRITQFYTDINVDGRFTPLGENRWGLKTWYPIDQIAEEVVHAVKPKKKKAKKAVAVVVDDFDDIDEEDDDDFNESDDSLDESEDVLIDEDLVDDDDEDEDLEIDEKLIVDDEFVLDEDDEDEDLDDEESGKK